MFGIDDLIIAAAVSSAAAGGASIFGGMMANDSREEAASSANKWGAWMQQGAQQHQNEMANFNARQAEIARNWSADMSNSAYQRAMKDMRAAGLNPILAYQQGGASPGQAVAGSGTGGAGFTPGAKADVQDVIGPAMGNALQAANVISGVQQASANVDQTRANTDLLGQEIRLRKEQQAQAQAHTAESVARTVTEGHRAGLVRNQAATELMNPALRAAETAAASAAAGEAGERTEGHRLENTRTRNYGPRSSAADAAANLEAAGRRLHGSGASQPFIQGWERIMEGLGRGQSGYSGPRSMPSPPRRGYVDDPYGLMGR